MPTESYLTMFEAVLNTAEHSQYLNENSEINKDPVYRKLAVDHFTRALRMDRTQLLFRPHLWHKGTRVLTKTTTSQTRMTSNEIVVHYLHTYNQLKLSVHSFSKHYFTFIQNRWDCLTRSPITTATTSIDIAQSACSFILSLASNRWLLTAQLSHVNPAR